MVSTIKNRPMFLRKEFTKQYTANANATVAVDITPTEEGYTPIGIVGATTGHGSSVIQQVRFLSNTMIRAYPRNLTGSAITADFIVQVLFYKV